MDNGNGSHGIIPLSTPDLGPLEKEAVLEALETGWVSSSGPQVDDFAKQIAALTGARFAVPLNSGTAALHLAMIVCGIQAGDKVLMPALSFVAAANAVRYLGAEPIFVDANPDSWQMDLDLAEAYLRNHPGEIQGILVVHVLGYMGEMNRWRTLADEFGIPLIEDAAEALGSKRAANHAGTIGDVGVLSFNGNKILTTGGGGMLLTNDREKAEKAYLLSVQAKRHPHEYLHEETGYNYRMTNLAAALGLAQLVRLEEFLQKRKKVFDQYQQAFQDMLPLKTFPYSPEDQHIPNHWLTTILHPEARQLEEILHVHSIESRKLWIPLNRLPHFSDAVFISREDHAYHIYEQSLSLPSGSQLSQSDQEKVVRVVLDFVK